jgi:signal-transduction protein with cAMP-binding, CBS, and nucleotidyltransferase domain
MKTAKEMVQEKGGEIVCVPVGTTVFEALRKMCRHKVGAILVLRNDDVAGIWTERDLLIHIVDADFDPKTALIENYMTTDLFFARHDETLYNLMDKFLGLHIRHLPVSENGKFIGLLSSGDVMKAAISAKSAELEKLNNMVSWEYYENWRWDPDKS